MSDLDKLEKKYEKGTKAKEIRQLAKDLEASDKAAFGIYPNAGKRAKREGPDSAQNAVSQAIAGFKSQWSGLDDEGKVGIGKGTPGIYYNTVALPALAGIVDEKYAPDFAVAADKKAGQIKEAVRKDMGIEEPRGALEHFAYAGGEMLGQIPIPASLMAKIVGGAKKMGLAGKAAAAPIEYLSPTIDPKAINYGVGTAFGGTLGTVLEEDPVKKALGGLIQKYDKGGKVGTFFSALDKAIETLKQKKGTGEQVLKQLETTPGVKPEELESRGIKQKLQTSPKITQEELLKTAKANKPPIPKRIKLGAGVPEDWTPDLSKKSQNILSEMGIEPVVNPEDRRMLGFIVHETGDIVDADLIKGLYPDELGFKVGPNGKDVAPEDAAAYKTLLTAVKEAQEHFDHALEENRTKFSQYSQSKGQENYREILLQHQDVGSPKIKQRIEELLKANPATEAEAQAVNEELHGLLDQISSPRQQFTASHWNEPDVLAHYRVSDATGPNGEKVLYVDEIQSDWHQKGRDARKAMIKDRLKAESKDIHEQAVEQLRDEIGTTVLNDENIARLKKIELALTKDRKMQLEQEIPENAGYRSYEDNEKLFELNQKIQRLRDVGMTTDEIKEYYAPGRIVPSYGGYDKVISFNSGEGTPAYQRAFNDAMQRAESAGVDRNTAMSWATKKAEEYTKHDWSVTVIEVDPKTGTPRRGADQRTHTTSPANHYKDELQAEAQKIERKVPDAPFKKNWHELAVKDILDLAAKEGYDKVAFSPGIEQVKRYSQGLRQAVDSIQYSPTADGHLLVEGIKDGRPVFSGKVLDDTFIDGQAEGKTLAEVFGGQVAKQIETESPGLFEQIKSTEASQGKKMPKMSADDLLNEHGDSMTEEQRSWLRQFIKDWEDNVDSSPAGRSFEDELSTTYDTWLNTQTLGGSRSSAAAPIGKIEGKGLTVGGEGMKSFYDQRLPSYVKNYAGKEFKAPTGRADISVRQAPPSSQGVTSSQIRRMEETISNEESDEFMERVIERSDELATEILERRGIRRGTPEFEEQHWDVMMEEAQDIAHERVLREMAMERLSQPQSNTLNAFTVDITPQMREKIGSEGQKLYGAVAPPLLPPMAGGAAALEAGKMAMEKEEQPKEQAPVIQDEPQEFETGGKVGKLTAAAKKASETVFHGGTYVPGEEIKKPLFTSVNKDLANSYTVDDFGKTKGELRALKHDAKKPAGEKELIKIAERLGIDVDFDNSPLSLLDSGMYGKKNVNRLIKELRKEGFDSAEGIDVGAGTPHTDRSTVLFPGTKTMPDEPQGFESGGRVGKAKEAAESLLRVLHGGPSRINLEQGKNLDVTTDSQYAVKRAQDKMSMFGQEGPPMVNKFDIPAKRLLRFEETYSPEDVALMRRFFGKLPEGKAMTGEEIYDAAQGKDFVLQGIAKAGGLAGYERPAAGSGGKGNWYRITEQEELTRKARGGLAHFQKPYR